MPSGLNLPHTTLLRDFGLIVGSEKPLVLIDIASAKVRRLIVVGCMVIVEELERSETTFYHTTSDFLHAYKVS